MRKPSGNDRVPDILKEKAERIRERMEEELKKVVHRTDVYREIAKMTDEELWEKLKKRKCQF